MCRLGAVISGQLVPPTEEYYVGSMVFQSSVYDYSDGSSKAVTSTCTQPEAIVLIVDELLNGDDETDVEYHCDNLSWRVYTCNGARLLCINCKHQCSKSVVCPGAEYGFVVNPCYTDCEGPPQGYNYVTAWTVLSAEFEKKAVSSSVRLLCGKYRQ